MCCPASAPHCGNSSSDSRPEKTGAADENYLVGGSLRNTRTRSLPRQSPSLLDEEQIGVRLRLVQWMLRQAPAGLNFARRPALVQAEFMELEAERLELPEEFSCVRTHSLETVRPELRKDREAMVVLA